MVLHKQKQESHEHPTLVVRNGWTGVNVADINYTADNPHLLKVFLFIDIDFEILDNEMCNNKRLPLVYR